MHDRARARFEARITRTDGCWIWTGAVGSHGYGNISLAKGTYDTAHRVAYELWVGPIPDGQIVCHTCDVRRCVNPKHLFLGTHKDNTQDARTKGRLTGPRNPNSPKGEDHPGSKLTEEQVRAILADTRKYSDIAAAFSIHVLTVSKIKRGLAWAHLGESAVPANRRRHAKLTEDQARAIRADTRTGAVIAQEYGISHVSVSNIKRRRTWAHVEDHLS